MYQIEIKVASKNGWHTPNEARAYYGRYAREGFTVHWWNTPNAVKDSDHDNIVNYILGKAQAATGSVNYVLSNNKITMLVNPDNVAWASQGGNPTTVSCEFSPHLNDEGYKKAGWLINELEGRFGHRLTLYPHSRWFQTACPGNLDINRMRAEADKWARGEYNPKPTPAPAPQPTPQPQPAPKIQYSRLNKATWVTVSEPTNLWNLDANKWADFKVVKPFAKGTPVEIVGRAIHPVGGTYLMTAHSFGTGDPADPNFKPAHNQGFNIKDMSDKAPEPAPQPVPVPTPEPTPTPQPVPVPVEPPKPTEYDKAQDNEIAVIKGTLNSLKALLVEFAKNILSKFGV